MEKNELKNIDKETKLKNSDLKVAKDSINEGNMKLQKALKENKLSRKSVQETQTLINMGINFKCKAEEEIKQLDNTRRKLSK